MESRNTLCGYVGTLFQYNLNCCSNLPKTIDHVRFVYFAYLNWYRADLLINSCFDDWFNNFKPNIVPDTRQTGWT